MGQPIEPAILANPRTCIQTRACPTAGRGACHTRPAPGVSYAGRIDDFQTETVMGKYFIAWLLGVPGIVLVLIYLFMH